MDSDGERLPIGDVLQGFAIHPLEEGWSPLEAFMLIKSLDQNGESSWSFRTSHPLNREELLGALTVQVELLRRRLLEEWIDDES